MKRAPIRQAQRRNFVQRNAGARRITVILSSMAQAHAMFRRT
jgi:hypothetical protein